MEGNDMISMALKIVLYCTYSKTVRRDDGVCTEWVKRLALSNFWLDRDTGREPASYAGGQENSNC
jgi:hypothetical protein